MPDNSDKTPGDERDDDILAVRVRVRKAQIDELLSRGGLDYGDHLHFSEGPEGIGQLGLFVSRAQIDDLRGAGYEVEITSNQSARLRERLDEVGQGDRFEGGRIPPRGLGRKIGGRGPRGQQPPPSPGPDDEAEPLS
jgi:hypothetical protein